jgi:large subunit ribosomal protein L20
MGRATNNPQTRHRRKKVLKRAKGYFQGRSKLYRQARVTVMRALRYSTVHRRLKKRDYRTLWITRISAAAEANGISYSVLISGLKKANVLLDRKSLSEIAQTDEQAFQEILKIAKQN